MSRDGIYHSACQVGRGEGILALEESFITTGLVSSMDKTVKLAIHHCLSSARNKHGKKYFKRVLVERRKVRSLGRLEGH